MILNEDILDIPLDEIDIEAHTEQISNSLPGGDISTTKEEKKDEILGNILFHGEHVVWIDKSQHFSTITCSKVFRVLWPLVVSLSALILGVYFYYSLNHNTFILLASIIVCVAFIGTELYMWNSFKAERINILTNKRAIKCIHRHNVVLDSISIPYSAIQILSRKEYSTLMFWATNPRNPCKPIPLFSFGNVRNVVDIERKIRNAIACQKHQFVEADEFRKEDHKHTEKDMYYKSLKTFLLLRSDHDTWPTEFRTLLEVNLEDDIEGKETVLWSYKPSLWKVWKKIVYIFIPIASIALLTLLYISIALAKSIVFLIGVGSLVFLFFGTLFCMGIMRTAIALTTRGVILLKTGLPPLIPWLEKRHLSYSRGINYSIKVPYDSIYPLKSSLDLKNLKGSIQILMDMNLELQLPDERTVAEILHNSYQLTQF